MNLNVFYGILIPFIGTSAGAACVFFMKKDLNQWVQRCLTGFAAGVMVAASVWSLLIPALEPVSYTHLTSDLLQNFSDKETAFQVHQVLHRLSEPYKEVFSLRVFGELSFGTISSLFGKSESWARVTYHRACKKIREELDHEDQL